MKNTKHTPGPWVATQFTGTYGGPDTWGVRLSNNTGVTPMLEANAHLMAAAPEMLAALEFLVREVNCVPGTGKNDGQIGHRHINAAISAIKKARGES